MSEIGPSVGIFRFDGPKKDTGKSQEEVGKEFLGEVCGEEAPSNTEMHFAGDRLLLLGLDINQVDIESINAFGYTDSHGQYICNVLPSYLVAVELKQRETKEITFLDLMSKDQAEILQAKKDSLLENIIITVPGDSGLIVKAEEKEAKIYLKISALASQPGDHEFTVTIKNPHPSIKDIVFTGTVKVKYNPPAKAKASPAREVIRYRPM
ncbi:hypothetical protein A3J90_08185 [candidate division WOR-1 bacterium RIFOXYC2_FULL_37_10]|uniref:Uncharacterized protein n=1 Tax=candidate division WOR-1 bacterium RIFOXYB2_FULL_37_13 TaxID=1802579 RepID=A0A1F4SQD4_UNCSA|nr:MAG: hypothetical protein A2310_07845 [candidate division WOR-1 bacterium RIFOXYB2_FULL_37_13]OGC37376.1 MAG: hypothetical protein A3J90_08185 [candidate division WOR-1 bacterium RIFOXYC2_FULL_37_10]